MQKYWNTVLDERGSPRAGVTVAVQQSGSNSTIYLDQAGATQKTNPITTDSRGYFEFYAAAGEYDLVVSGTAFATYTISDGAVIGMESADVSFTQSGTDASAGSVQTELRRWVRPEHFGAAGDGTTNDRAALAAADARATSSGGITFQSGKTYLCSTSLTITAMCYFEPGASISIPTGQTITFSGRVIALAGDPKSGDGTASYGSNLNLIYNALGFSIGKEPATLSNQNVTFTYSDGTYSKFGPYQFGIRYGQAGGANDNRLELFLGETDTTAPEFSVRHNGNGKGAIVQARNAADDDGMFLNFTDSSYPFVRWGNAGPYLIKEDANTLVIRNYGTAATSHRLYVANTWTTGGTREYLQLGFSSNRGVVRVTGAGGGTQRPLDLDGSIITFQAAGTNYWTLNASGHFVATTDNASDIGATNATRPRHAHLAGYLAIGDGIAAPGAGTGEARIYVDTADGDLKVVFADGTVKTISVDT
jgi:hypothetical protein